jgi:hypothetical protein
MAQPDDRPIAPRSASGDRPALPRGVGLVLAGLCLVHLVPVWAFHFLPTQDGPSHVWNAVVLAELSHPGAPEAEFLEVRPQPIPNWTSHLILAGLTRVLPPLVAEKVLVSIYVIGLAASVAYFLAPFGALGPTAALGFLLVFNRCFFLGFYNYVLSLIPLFFALGLFVRQADRPWRTSRMGLGLLLVAAYFTHLAGAVLAVVALFVFARLGPRPVAPRLRAVAVASWPALALVGWYLVFSAHAFSGAGPRPRLAWGGLGSLVDGATAGLHRELFAVHAGAWPIGLLGLAAAAVGLGVGRGAGADGGGRPWRRPLVVLALVLFAAFLAAPAHVGPRGSEIEARLAPLPFVLGLALVPAPKGARAWGAAAASTALVIGLNLFLVLAHIQGQQRPLEEFTRGAAFLPRGVTLFAVKTEASSEPLVQPRAVEYYCLATRAVCLSSYEAGTNHFPLRFRPGVKERVKENRPGSYWAGAVLSDGASAEGRPLPDEPYHLIFGQGPLRLYLRLDAHAWPVVRLDATVAPSCARCAPSACTPS